MRRYYALALIALLGCGYAALAEDAPPVAPVTPGATDVTPPPTTPVGPETGNVTPTPATPETPATPVTPAVEPPKAPAPLPAVTPDNSVFRRTPVLDGVIEPGEWDTYYTFAYDNTNATTYVDWDDENLYVAAKTSSPTDFLVILDGSGDGWFQGNDNYEITAKRTGSPDGTPTFTVSRYQGKEASGSNAPLVAAESTAFTLKSSTAPDNCVCEIAIPRSAVPGLELKQGKKVGIKVALGVGTTDVQWIPPAPLGEVQTATLVTSKKSVQEPMTLDVELRDLRIVPGDEVMAKLTIRNKSKEPAKIDTLIIGGEGKTAKLMGSQLVRLDGIAPGKSFSTTFKTGISRTATPGSAAIGVQGRSGDEVVASGLVSFDVVPNYQVSLDTSSTSAQNGERRVVVVIRNNTSRSAFGKAKLSLPEGWTVRRSETTKQFSARDEDSITSVVYRVIPPAKPEPRVPVLVEVQINGQTLSASGTIESK